ncbi:hypothetical protein [Spirosoma daeguense]
MRNSTPGNGFLVPLAYNLMSRALSDSLFFDALVRSSSATDNWFFNYFFVMPRQPGSLLDLPKGQVVSTKSISEDFLNFVKTYSMNQQYMLQTQLVNQELTLNYRDQLMKQVNQLQEVNKQMTQFQKGF